MQGCSRGILKCSESWYWLKLHSHQRFNKLVQHSLNLYSLWFLTVLLSIGKWYCVINVVLVFFYRFLKLRLINMFSWTEWSISLNFWVCGGLILGPVLTMWWRRLACDWTWYSRPSRKWQKSPRWLIDEQDLFWPRIMEYFIYNS